MFDWYFSLFKLVFEKLSFIGGGYFRMLSKIAFKIFLTGGELRKCKPLIKIHEYPALGKYFL